MNYYYSYPLGLLVFEPKVYGDQRGYFLESWNNDRYNEMGLTHNFVQDNMSRSSEKVLRGLHFQNPNGQGKLVSVLEGAVFDVAVDIRVGSPTFGKWYGIILDGISKRQMYIPEGFAHGFVVLSDSAIFAYKCTAYYAPQNEFSLLWNDPSINITWPIDDPSLSLKDSQGLTLNELKHQGCLPQYKLAQHKPEHIGKQSEYLDTEINDYNLQEKIAAGI